jgi:hypothetical protein
MPEVHVHRLSDVTPQQNRLAVPTYMPTLTVSTGRNYAQPEYANLTSDTEDDLNLFIRTRSRHAPHWKHQIS